MNLLKSMFIPVFMMISMAGAGYSAWMLLLGSNTVAWGGAFLANAPFILVISWIMISRRVARTTAHLPLINILGGCGSALTVWNALAQSSTLLAPAIALSGWSGFLIYTYWYSKFDRKPNNTLRVGTSLPAFKIKNLQGQTISSASFIGKPSVLVFYRGNWCPLCMAQIRELASRYRSLGEHGVRVALISPQPHSNTLSLAKKYNVDFDFLTDEGNVAARTLGLDIAHGIPAGMQMMGYDSESVLPTVVITDRNGIILWTHETDNYRIRPEPETYFEVFRANGIISTTASGLTR